MHIWCRFTRLCSRAAALAIGLAGLASGVAMAGPAFAATPPAAVQPQSDAGIHAGFSIVTRICTPATIEPNPTPNDEYCLTITSAHPSADVPVVVKRNYNDVGRRGLWRVVEDGTVSNDNVRGAPSDWVTAHLGDPIVVIFWVQDPRLCLGFQRSSVRLADCREYVWVWTNGQAMYAFQRTPPTKPPTGQPKVLTAPDLNLGGASIRPFNRRNEGFLQRWSRR